MLIECRAGVEASRSPNQRCLPSCAAATLLSERKSRHKEVDLLGPMQAFSCLSSRGYRVLQVKWSDQPAELATGETSSARVDIEASLVRRLIASQFPHWAHLPVQPIAFGGWDNRTFHLGEEMTVRLPSAARYSAQGEKENY